MGAAPPGGSWARPRALTAVWVLAGDTWRQSWREVVVRTELASLLVLSLVAGAAAIGSPTAGDGAIQMLALCLMLVPFAIVLAAGQIWRSADAEVAVFARPVSASGYVLGRVAGLVAVGSFMLAAVDVMGSLALFGLARLPLVSALGWDTAWCLLAVGPSLVLTAAAAVWLAGRTGGGSRYFLMGILGSLVMAFLQYKWVALAAALDPRLFLWSPFPGLLTLGLALPPELLGPTPGWLWANRAVWLAAAGLLAIAAIRERDRRRTTPSAHPARDRRWHQGMLGALALAVVWLEVTGLSLSPGLLPASAASAAAAGGRVAALGPLSLDVSVSAATGAVAGVARVRLSARGGGASLLWFWLNRGLSVTRATWNGQGVPVAHQGARVLPGSAARLVAVRVPGGRGTLGIAYRGRLLPLATWLPTPPFPVGGTSGEAYAGGGRVYWSGGGAWYPRLLAGGAAGRPLFLATSLSWAVTATAKSLPHWSAVPAAGAPGILPAVLWLSGPYHATRVDGRSVYTRRPVTALQAAALASYVAADQILARWLPGYDGSVPPLVVDPLLTAPAVTPALAALPGHSPYCAPVDLVAGGCATSQPTTLAPWLRLAAASWQSALGVGSTNAAAPGPSVFPAGDERRAIVPVLAAATVIRADAGGPVARAVALAGYQRPGGLPVLGRLTPTQVGELKQLAGWAAGASPSAWSAMTARVVQTAARGPLTWSRVLSAESG